MQIRVAQKGDLKALTEIYNQAIVAGGQTADLTPFTEKEREKWLLAHPPERYPILLAEQSHNILGYLSISAWRQGREALKHAAEVSYYIHSNWQRQGIGFALMQAAEKEALSRGIDTLFAILLEVNKPSIALLKKCNYAQWGYLPAVAKINKTKVGQLIYGKSISQYN